MKKLFTSTIGLLVLCFLLLPAISFAVIASEVTLAWDPPEVSTDVAGYMVHYGTQAGIYSEAIDVGNTTSYSVANLTEGLTYYFAVTAYNAAGSESPYSNEVSKNISPSQYLLIASKPGTGQGLVSSAGSEISCGEACMAVFDPDTVVTLSATPEPGSTFEGWSGGGCSGTGLCMVTMSANATITAIFKANPVNYTITASVNGMGGTISPAGETSVVSGGSKAFSIIPATGYSIAGVTVDGTAIGAVSSYTFDNVTANHTIVATFSLTSPVSYSITASVNGAGGTISPAGVSSVVSGGSKAFSIIPATGYTIASVTVDGAEIGAVSSYTFTNVTANHTIAATFSLTVSPVTNYSITASVNGAGGTISPAGASSVVSGGSMAFSITPAAGYSIAGVTVDGAQIGAVGSYTFNNVTANHMIVASFSLTVSPVANYSITASVTGTGGIISPSGASSIVSGGSKQFSIIPATGYSVAGVKVDGTAIGAVSSYTFNNVTANHTITATFKRKGSPSLYFLNWILEKAKITVIK